MDMPFAVAEDVVICWPCHRHTNTAASAPDSTDQDLMRRAGDLKRPAGWRRDYGCHDCGTKHPRYTYGRCDHCALAAVFDHFTPDAQARRTLEPLREALLSGPRPSSSLRWLRRNPQLLIDMGNGTLPIEHAALDALPRSRTTETIRGQLVATGCLPKRNTYAADFQSWLTIYVKNVELPAHGLVLHEYGTWRLLPRIHRPRLSVPQTYSTLQLAKSRIRAAHSFLIWLPERATELSRATQADVDEFISQNNQLAGALAPFLTWTSKTRKSRKLTCYTPPSDHSGPAITPEERWRLLRRLLHDDALHLADRVMGAIILTYAMPLTKTLMIRTDQVRITGNAGTGIVEVYLQLGPTEVRLPPVLDELVARQVRQGRLPHKGPAIAPGPWLFPGTKAGQPVSQARAVVRLQQLGLHPGPGRARALLHLAARIEAPLLAQSLGITPGTAVRWSELAGRTYNGYVARTTKKAIDGPSTSEEGPE
ncbi:hypothetical protein [Streptomyces sp. NPDC050485]|uniref:hypothetical protein n=1 Tax=Streptomyces sp. NPDC050485 TaxID=3365617 RepID=UPI00378A303B